MKRLWILKHAAPLALTAVAAFQAVPPACAAPPVPVNRYTFNDGTVTDIIGGQNGTLVDPSGIAFYTGGQVRLTNNNNYSSNQNFSLPTTRGAYVDLPNGLISSAANSGAFYQFSLEFWATIETNRDWARLGDFGTSNDGENTSNGAGASDYLIVVPRTGGRPTPAETNKFSASTHSLTGQEDFVVGPSELSVGVQHHVVVTVDQNDTSTYANGVLSLYLDGALVNSGPVEDEGFVDFTLFNDNNNWLGRAQWPDPLFDGSYNEFSVYNYALNASEVSQSFIAGPVPGELAVPQLLVNRETGEVRVNNATGEQVSLLSYSIASASGSLDPVSWTSIDNNVGFDPDGTWTKTSTTPVSLAEGTTGNGGQIAAATGRTIGSAWNPSPFEDLIFNFTLAGSSTPLAGQVVYTGNDGVAIAQSDLDADGDTDAADFALFAAASQSDLTGMSAYELYRHGDLNGDGANNYIDFRMFKDAFIAANGAPAFAALVASVPEPTSLLLAIGGALGLAFRRR